MNKHALELNSPLFLTFQLAQGAQRPHAITTAPATTGTRGQESAAATEASTGPHASSVCQTDTAPAAGVRLSYLSISLLMSSLNCFISNEFLSKPRNAPHFQHQHFPTPSTSSRGGMARGLGRKEGGGGGKAGRGLRSFLCRAPPILAGYINNR